MSQRFLDAVRHPPAIATRLEVWRGGTRVDPYGDAGLAIYSGEVQVDRTKQIRRTLTGVRVDATDDMWDLLSPPGTELRAWRGFRYLNGETELVPVGRFVLDSLTETYGGNWDGTIDTAPDRMVLVQRARFLTPRWYPAGYRVADLIATLLTEVLGPVVNLSSSGAVLPNGTVFERDRAKTISDLATSISADVSVAADGTPTVRDLPQLDTPVWTVDTGDQGVLYQASRQRTADQSYSAVVAAPAAIDGTPPFAAQVAYDNDPTSPTYYLGPFGLVPYFMSSELFGDAGQAMAAALNRLPLVSGPRAQLRLTAECNPALADSDTILVELPRRLRGQTAVTERHLIGTLTVPLTADGTQAITSFSSVADIPGSE